VYVDVTLTRSKVKVKVTGILNFRQLAKPCMLMAMTAAPFQGFLVSERNAVVRPSVVCLSSVCRLSVVCNVRAPYSGGRNFSHCFYAIWYLCGHLLTSAENFTQIVPGEPPGGRHKCKRVSQI